jgi:hypothetical protein
MQNKYTLTKTYTDITYDKNADILLKLVYPHYRNYRQYVTIF